MKSYDWWLKQKKRIRKKYTLVCGMYMSPKEAKIFLKRLRKKNYAIDLGNVLRTFNTDKFIRFINRNRKLYEPNVYLKFMRNKDNKRWLLEKMAKMVMSRTDMNEETRDKAKKILADLEASL